jgi:CRISPR/Cas system CSM-associated protein Csm3 (group 7 of RAMP superfamily)
MIDLNTLIDNRVITIPLTAVIDTALCVGAGGSDGSLADKPIVRNAKGQLLIPASQLKGRLRHECEKLARGLGWQIFESPAAEALCPREDQVLEQFRSLYKVDGYRGYHCFISKIFGNPILPSKIVVDDLICNLEREDLPEVLRPGVTINRSRRTAEAQKLFFLETSPANAQLEFKGEIHLLPGCPTYAKAIILAGLRHIHALGGSKSAGLGWLTWKELEKLSQEDLAWPELLPEAKS